MTRPFRVARALTVLSLSCALALPAHAGRDKQAVDGLIEEALSLAATDRAAAVDALREAHSRASGPDKPWVALHLGEQLRLAGDTRQAATWWLEALEGPTGPAARAGLALLDVAPCPSDDSLAALASEPPGKEAPDTLRADRLGWLAVARLRAQQDAAPLLQRVEQLTTSAPALRGAVHERLDTAVACTPETAEGSPASLAEALARRDAEAAEAFLAAEPAVAEAARALLATAPVPGKVGLLLPLEGRYGAVGRQLAEALQAGWAAAGGTPDQLVLRSSGDTEESALAAAESLASEVSWRSSVPCSRCRPSL